MSQTVEVVMVLAASIILLSFIYWLEWVFMKSRPERSEGKVEVEEVTEVEEPSAVEYPPLRRIK